MSTRKRPATSDVESEQLESEAPAQEEDSEDEEAWDEVDVTADNSASALALATAGQKAFDIVISSKGKAKGVLGKKK